MTLFNKYGENLQITSLKPHKHVYNKEYVQFVYFGLMVIIENSANNSSHKENVFQIVRKKI